MLSSLVSLQQGNVKKPEKSMKIVNIEGEIIVSSEQPEEFQSDFQETFGL